MKNLSSKFQKLIVWLTGYLNIVAFVLAGGYIFFKTEDDDVKESSKTVLILLAIFTALEIVRVFFYYIFSIASNGSAIQTLNNLASVVGIIKVVVFVVFFVLDLVGIKIIPIKRSSVDKKSADSEDVSENKD